MRLASRPPLHVVGTDPGPFIRQAILDARRLVAEDPSHPVDLFNRASEIAARLAIFDWRKHNAPRSIKDLARGWSSSGATDEIRRTVREVAALDAAAWPDFPPVVLPGPLESFVGGYLHQDWDVEGDDVEEILGAQKEEDRRQIAAEARALLEAGIDEQRATEMLERWGCCYIVEGTSEPSLSLLRAIARGA